MATILIVEDESVLAMKIEIDLLGMGHKVVGIADSAAKAFELTELWNPDIILMDIVLHGEMNGIDAAMKICEQNDCKIIYITAHTDAITIEKAQSTKHVGFLHKPFEPYQLQRGIDKALE
jgi:CheY-like chemotaxis protein